MGTRTERVFQEVTLDDLGDIRRFVLESTQNGACDREDRDELVVAVNEAVANIVRHGYKNEPGEIRVSVACSSEMVTVTLVDGCPGFDPTSAPSPDVTLGLEERPFGGMGVHMMRTFCDELNYRVDSRGRNELVLLKKIDR